ncbi:MAG: radical SAM protein, partial [Planctomycetota bacterium]|nr:radical SAM protein [Planctomycetota bacterium]
VRVAGCDLACSYCDTPDARPPDAGRDMTVAEVLARLDETGLPWCMITGGEPLLQAEDVNALVVALIRRGHEVMVETSGAHPIDLVDVRARRIVDVKTPGSGMADRMDWRNLERLTPRDEVKFVLTGRPDYDWAKEVVESHGLVARCPVLFGSADSAALVRRPACGPLPSTLSPDAPAPFGLGLAARAQGKRRVALAACPPVLPPNRLRTAGRDRPCHTLSAPALACGKGLTPATQGAKNTSHL